MYVPQVGTGDVQVMANVVWDDGPVQQIWPTRRPRSLRDICCSKVTDDAVVVYIREKEVGGPSKGERAEDGSQSPGVDVRTEDLGATGARLDLRKVLFSYGG